MSRKLTVRQAAEILGVTPGLVNRYIKQDRISAEKEETRTQRGRKGFLIDRKELAKFAKIPRRPGPKVQPIISELHV